MAWQQPQLSWRKMMSRCRRSSTSASTTSTTSQPSVSAKPKALPSPAPWCPSPAAVGNNMLVRMQSSMAAARLTPPSRAPPGTVGMCIIGRFSTRLKRLSSPATQRPSIVEVKNDSLVRTQSNSVAARLSPASWALQDTAGFTACPERSDGDANVRQNKRKPRNSGRRRVENRH
jgi:hypothetical protein